MTEQPPSSTLLSHKPSPLTYPPFSHLILNMSFIANNDNNTTTVNIIDVDNIDTNTNICTTVIKKEDTVGVIPRILMPILPIPPCILNGDEYPTAEQVGPELANETQGLLTEVALQNNPFATHPTFLTLTPSLLRYNSPWTILS